MSAREIANKPVRKDHVRRLLLRQEWEGAMWPRELEHDGAAHTSALEALDASVAEPTPSALVSAAYAACTRPIVAASDARSDGATLSACHSSSAARASPSVLAPLLPYFERSLRVELLSFD